MLSASADERPSEPANETFALEERWILSRLEAVRADVDDARTGWDLGRVARALFHFAWDEYCDWYLELAKQRVDGSDDDAVAGMQAAAPHDPSDCLKCRWLAPVLPEIYRQESA